MGDGEEDAPRDSEDVGDTDRVELTEMVAEALGLTDGDLVGLREEDVDSLSDRDGLGDERE